ncbi:PIN domain-containing protein [Calothrix sp. PCC 6303]|uniref:PIN domain-containing protein n=1 Tax=Calothrix sp. PCC 6303 TaxID=1170562 RepID=UPI0002A011D4|nr:PIN domain-containing protein [Calothrix sp. PCC 6303]AFY99961.1 hypothetical protein Cal6303_0897 [Calothrix sp. PCC 6303]
MIGILVDADLILDALMNRNRFMGNVDILFDRIHPLIKMYITDIGWQKIYTYASKFQNVKTAQAIIDWLKEKIQVCQVHQSTLQEARLLPIQDFESAVELACASSHNLDAIVTHKDYDFAAAADNFWIWSVTDLKIRINLENQLQKSQIQNSEENFTCQDF